MTENYNAKVSGIIPLSKTAGAIRFKLDKKANFLPGQFMSFNFLLREKKGFIIPSEKTNIQKRLFSISSSPNSDHIEITVKKTEHPFVSKYLVDVIENDETCKIEGPYGKFYLDINKSGKFLLFLAAGSGIAPFMSMLRFLKEKQFPIPAHLFFVNKSEDEILWRNEIESFYSEKFSYTFTLTQDHHNSKWEGQRGRLNKEILAPILRNNVYVADCYICGPLSFVRATKDLLLELGVVKEQIMTEIYE